MWVYIKTGEGDPAAVVPYAEAAAGAGALGCLHAMVCASAESPAAGGVLDATASGDVARAVSAELLGTLVTAFDLDPRRVDYATSQQLLACFAALYQGWLLCRGGVLLSVLILCACSVCSFYVLL